MRSIRLLFLPGIILLFAAFTGTATKIFWTASNKLTWNNFSGPPDASSPHEASTSWHLDTRFSARGDSVRFTVKCWFSPAESWVKTGQQTNDLLAHEQGHFDLAEVYTRRLRKSLAEKTFTQADLKATYKALHNQTVADCRARQDEYDSETNHSIIKDKQQLWQKKIAAELESLKAYTDTLVLAKVSH